MSLKNLDEQHPESKTNPHLESSIVHKPFATGTVNFFNPHRNKSNNLASQSTPSKIFLKAELEQTKLPLPSESTSQPASEPPEIEYHDRHWLNIILSPWSVSAIAMVFLANLISGAVIWRNYRLTADSSATVQEPLTTLSSANLADGEFVPLNLNTLSRLKTAESKAEKSLSITPISPALAPINNAMALSSADSEYHYILSEYTGDRSLASARRKVPQVSLVNFPQGVFIYLGAFRDRDQAKEFGSQLEQDGLVVQVYPFD